MDVLDNTGNSIKDKKVDEVTYNDIEKKAMEDGWIPPDKFDKEEQGKSFISAEKFIENGSFFKKINEQKSKIEKLEDSISQLNSHYEKVAQNERKKAQEEYKNEIEILKREKLQALEEGDNQRIIDIDEKMMNKEKPSNVDPTFERFFSSWVSENKWYNEDQKLKDYADMIGDNYSSRNVNTPYQQIFEYVTEEVKQRYPDKFIKGDEENMRKTSVEGSSISSVSDHMNGDKSKNNKSDYNSLTSDEKTIYKNFERMRVFKTDEEKKRYIKEVISLR